VVAQVGAAVPTDVGNGTCAQGNALAGKLARLSIALIRRAANCSNRSEGQVMCCGSGRISHLPQQGKLSSLLRCVGRTAE